MQPFHNSYADAERAAAYATLEFPGTYYLAFRDLPEIFARHVSGRVALDFGCGTGRSTRFLRKLGFEPTGVDISAEMLELARAADPDGAYLLVADGELGELPRHHFDLALAMFTFDNIAGVEHRVRLLTQLRECLRATGTLVLVDSTPELYMHEWVSFSTSATFPGNLHAGPGDAVFTMMLDVADRRPVHDILWLAEDYRRAFEQAGLTVHSTCKPLGKPDEPFDWVNETRIAPWVIYVTGP